VAVCHADTSRLPFPCVTSKESAVSADVHQVLAAEGGCHLFSGCGFTPPGTDIFFWQPLFSLGPLQVTKPVLLMLVSAFVVVGFFWAAFAKPKLVPGKLQLVGELAYTAIRDGISRELIGKKGDKYIPLLVSLFFFIWIMNIWSVIPLAQFPVSSIIAFPAVLAAIVYVTWVSLTFKRHGFVGFFKNVTGYDKSLGPVLPLVMVIEFFSNLLVRPFTHAVRLFANMFAGHLMLVMFTVASWYLLNSWMVPAAGVSFVMAVVMIGFELFVQAVQAYVFVLLASSYVQGALAEHH
jgi:F-type H+-transporting ATPase subunit a